MRSKNDERPLLADSGHSVPVPVRLVQMGSIKLEPIINRRDRYRSPVSSLGA